ncbi:MAG: metalloregulator ArsR/SmtB family transcription factor [Clostridia bacterium]
MEEKTDNPKKVLHKDKTISVLNTMPSNNTIEELAQFFKIISDTTRIKILYTISKRKLCVIDIASAISMSQSAVSHQLKNLKISRIVKCEKIGKQVYYSLNDKHVEKLFSISLIHIEEGKSGRRK